MRILIIIHQFFPEYAGGTERVALNLARMAQRAGHGVEVLACLIGDSTANMHASNKLTDAYETVYEGVPVTLIPRSFFPVTADYSLGISESKVDLFSAWIRLKNFDIAHVMHPMRMITAIKAVQNCGLPYVLTLTDFFLPCSRINLVNIKGEQCQGPRQGQQCISDCKVPPWNDQALLGRYQQAHALLLSASRCIAPSNYVAEKYISTFGNIEIQIIPHGIDLLAMVSSLEKFQDKVFSAGIRELVLGYVGTIVPQKGLHVLLKALALLPILPVRLIVAGSVHGDKKYAEEIESLVKKDNRVQMMGQCDAEQVMQLLHGLDVLCLPSLVPESFSLVLRESAVMGVPALVSNLGAPAEFVVQEKVSGKTLPPGDEKAWANAIQHLYENPQQLLTWRSALPLPVRIEEEAFLYESLYRQFRRED